MSGFLAVLSAFGGMGAVGGLIDLVTYRHRDGIKDAMISWWIRFDDVKFSNFGAKEAEYVVALLDRWTGRSFWSAKRWKVVATIAFLFLSFSCFYISIYAIATTSLPLSSRAYVSFLASIWEVYPPTLMVTFGRIAMVIVAFAASLTILRITAQLVKSLNPSGIYGVLLFCLLFLVHLFLLVTWSQTVIYLLSEVPSALIATNFHLNEEFFELVRFHFGKVWGQGKGVSEVIQPLLDPPSPIAWISLSNVFKSLMDISANGARLVFSLAFLGAAVFGSILRPLISNVWLGLIESGKPVFATLFGLVGGIFAAVHAL